MRRLIIYIRQCFCKHELVFDELKRSREDINCWGDIKKDERYIESQTCTKCGYHTSYKKFGR